MTCYAEPLLGWRVWHVRGNGDGYGLASWSRDATWPARERMEARCRRLLSQAHHAPRLGHRCGIYAVRTRELARALLDELPPLPGAVALGRVSLWGRVIENTLGWRAQYAYPYELELIGAPDGMATALRDRYAVDVS